MAARALRLAGLALAVRGACAVDCHIDSPMAAPANGNYGGACATKLDFNVGEGCTLSCGAGFAVSGDGPVCVDVNTWENLGTQRCVAAAPAPPPPPTPPSDPDEVEVETEVETETGSSKPSGTLLFVSVLVVFGLIAAGIWFGAGKSVALPATDLAQDDSFRNPLDDGDDDEEEMDIEKASGKKEEEKGGWECKLRRVPDAVKATSASLGLELTPNHVRARTRHALAQNTLHRSCAKKSSADTMFWGAAGDAAAERGGAAAGRLRRGQARL